MKISTYLVSLSVLLSFISNSPFTFAQETPINESSELIVELNGEARFYLQETEGAKFGVYNTDILGLNHNDVDLSVIPGYQAVTLSNPKSGNYVLGFEFRYDGYTTSEIVLTYLHRGELVHQSKHLVLVEHGDHQTYSFTISDENHPRIQLSSSFESVQNLQANKSENNTMISWDPVGDSSTRYQLWSRQDNNSLDYTFVTETQNVSIPTNILWGQQDISEGVVSKYTEFRVITVNGERHSMFSHFVRNDDMDGDGLSDLYEEEYNTDPLMVDTDSDELSDYYEIRIYETNPNSVDSDEDSYADADEVRYDSDPLDTTSVPVSFCAVPVDGGSWFVEHTCRLKESITFNGKLVIGSLAKLIFGPEIYLILGSH